MLNGHQETIHTVPVECTLQSVDGSAKEAMCACTADSPTGNLQAVDWCELRKEWTHLRQVPFPTLPRRHGIDLLLGADYAHLQLAQEEAIGQPGEPIARCTPLGWTCEDQSLSSAKGALCLDLHECKFV